MPGTYKCREAVQLHDAYELVRILTNGGIAWHKTLVGTIAAQKLLWQKKHWHIGCYE